MAIWHEAYDMATEALDDIQRQSGEPTPDQKLALAQIWATLSVAQELSGMRNDGLPVHDTPEFPGSAPDTGKSPLSVQRAEGRIPTRSTRR